VEQARRSARAGLVTQNLPGLSVAVGIDGEIAWAEGFGWADMEKRVPVAPAMRFRIGHTSKALTSAAVGLLLEKGRLRLEDEIQTYVPEFPEKQWPVTLRQLMGNVAGVRHYESDEDSSPSAHCERAVEGLDPAGNARHMFDKELFVSPFIDMEATYEFRMRPPDERAALLIREHLPSGHLLTATFVATGVPLTTRALWRAFATHPMMTLKVIGGIHWQALRLWLKGAPFRRHGGAPDELVTIDTLSRETVEVP